MAHRFKWDDLQFITAVIDNGSLSSASRKLGVNHATVQRRINAFEKNQGIQLFDKNQMGYKLTTQGRQVLDSLKLMKDAANRLERTISGTGTPFEGPVTVTSTDTLCQTFLIPHITALCDLYPNMKIKLISTNYRLNLGELDAEISIRPAKTIPDDLEGEFVGKMEFGAYATRQYWQENTSNDPKDHQWIGVMSALSQSPVGIWQDKHLDDNFSFYADSFLTMKQFAECGVGIGIMPRFLCPPNSKLTLSSQISIEMETNLWVAAHRDLSNSPRIQALIGYFVDVFGHDHSKFGLHPAYMLL